MSSASKMGWQNKSLLTQFHPYLVAHNLGSITLEDTWQYTCTTCEVAFTMNFGCKALRASFRISHLIWSKFTGFPSCSSFSASCLSYAERASSILSTLRSVVAKFSANANSSKSFIECCELSPQDSSTYVHVIWEECLAYHCIVANAQPVLARCFIPLLLMKCPVIKDGHTEKSPVRLCHILKCLRASSTKCCFSIRIHGLCIWPIKATHSFSRPYMLAPISLHWLSTTSTTAW